MPEPIIETISAAIATQLGTILAADGYSEDAVVVRPKTFAGYDPEHGQIALIQEDRVPTEDGAENRANWTQSFAIVFYMRPSEDDATAGDTFTNRRAADIEKALAYASRSGWWVDGMVDYRLIGPSPMPDETESGGGFYTLEVDYRHNDGDPYTA